MIASEDTIITLKNNCYNLLPKFHVQFWLVCGSRNRFHCFTWLAITNSVACVQEDTVERRCSALSSFGCNHFIYECFEWSSVHVKSMLH